MEEIPLTNHQFKIKGNKLWTLTQEYYDELKSTYLLHDVEGEMRKAKLWCRNVNKSRRKTAKGMSRFLNTWMSNSEASGYVTVDPEKSPSEVIYARNVQEKIYHWEGVIKEWPIEKLRSSRSFMSAYATYPEFRAWVQKQLPDRTPPEPHPPINESLDRASGCEEGILTGTQKKGKIFSIACQENRNNNMLLRPDHRLPDSVLGSQLSSDGDLPPPNKRQEAFEARLKEIRELRDSRPNEIGCTFNNQS